MFCPNCGKQLDANARFCGGCGTAIGEAAPAKPAAPAAPVAPFSMKALFEQLKPFAPLFVLVIAVFALALSIFHFGGNYDITATVSYRGESISESGPVADLLEESDEFPMILIGNLLFGFANLVIAAVATLLFLKDFKKLPFYDNFIAKFVKLSPLFLMGVVGAVAALLQMICYLLSTQEIFGATMSFGVHGTTWLALFVYAGLAVLDKVVLNKKEKPAAVEEPAAE